MSLDRICLLDVRIVDESAEEKEKRKKKEEREWGERREVYEFQLNLSALKVYFRVRDQDAAETLFF